MKQSLILLMLESMRLTISGQEVMSCPDPSTLAHVQEIAEFLRRAVQLDHEATAIVAAAEQGIYSAKGKPSDDPALVARLTEASQAAGRAEAAFRVVVRALKRKKQEPAANTETRACALVYARAWATARLTLSCLAHGSGPRSCNQ